MSSLIPAIGRRFAGLLIALLVGANSMQRAVQVPAALITALNGLVVVFVVSSDLWRRRAARRRQLAQAAEGPPAAPTLTQLEAANDR